VRPEASGACRHLPAWQYVAALLAALYLVPLSLTSRFRLGAGIMGRRWMRDDSNRQSHIASRVPYRRSSASNSSIARNVRVRGP
jgi:hypothetical protein